MIQHTIFYTLFLKFCFALLNPNAQVIYYNETNIIPSTSTRFTGQIQPDGYLNENDWSNSPTIYRFYHNPTKIADFRFGHNDTFLFLGLEVQDPDLQSDNCTTYNDSCMYFEDVSIEIGFGVTRESDHNSQQLYKLMMNIYNQYAQLTGVWYSGTDTRISNGIDAPFPLFSGVVVNGTISPRYINDLDTDSGFTMEVAIPKSSFMSTPNSSFEVNNIFFNFGINFEAGQEATYYWATESNDEWVFPQLILVEDCNVSLWGPWSDCNCSSELQFRERSILIAPAGPGEPCPYLSENATCTCGIYVPEPLIVTSLSNDSFHGEIIINVSISTTTPIVRIFGNLSIGSSGNVDLQDSKVIILGDFVNDGHITLSGNSTLNISGCAHFNGTLHIDLSKRKDLDSIISYNCRVGSFKEITFGNTGECTKASTQYQGKSMSLSLTEGCEDWLPVILGVSLGFVAVLAVVVIVFVLMNESIKAKVFPYRHKKPDLLDS